MVQRTSRATDGKTTENDVKITKNDVKAGYECLAARYASWAKEKKQSHIFGSMKLAVAGAETPKPPALTRKRGMIMNLHPVGGYPTMLGQTYNAEVGMGTPAQLFNLTADTGSMLTWAVAATCPEADCPGVKGKKLYSASKSRTSKALRDDHEAYGDGEMDLKLFSDVVGLGQVAIKDATVGGAIKTFERDGMLEHDGLLGLGRKLNADPEPILDTMVKQDKKFDEMLSLDFGASASMEVGGYNFEKYSKLSFFQVGGDEGWSLSKSSVTAARAAKTETVDLLLDSGSSVSMLPASRVAAIMERPGIKVKKTETEPIIYSMPCDTKLGIQLVLPDGSKLAIRDEDLLMQSNDATMPGCLSLLLGTTNPFLPAVAGTPMLKSIYTVLHKTSEGDWIGVAPLQR